jgi:hypothetical protein
MREGRDQQRAIRNHHIPRPFPAFFIRGMSDHHSYGSLSEDRCGVRLPTHLHIAGDPIELRPYQGWSELKFMSIELLTR